MRQPRQRKPVVREECPTCWTKYGRSLWVGECLCNQKVSTTFTCPGTLSRDIDPKDLPKDPPKKSKSKKDLAS